MLRHRAHADAEGRWEMVLVAPDPRLAGVVVGDYVGWHELRHRPGIRREVPKSLVPVILNFAAPFDVYAPGNGDGLDPFGSFLAGAHDSYALTRQQANRCLQFNLSFLGAFRLLRLPMDSLANRVVTLDSVLGRSVAALVEELGNLPGWAARFRRLDRWLLERLAEAPQAAPEVRSAMAAIAGSGGTLSIGALAAAEGVSRKRLIQLFRESVGLPPKRIARLVRFERAMALLLQRPAVRLADIALDSGYSDQAHFNRDFRAMTGATPGTIFDPLPAETVARLAAGKKPSRPGTGCRLASLHRPQPRRPAMAKQQPNPSVIPAIRYRDAPKAIDWLQKAFGFERHFVVEGEGGRIDHAQLARPGGMVMLGSKGKPDPKNPWADAPGGVYVVVADVDAHHARAKAAGAEIVMPLRDTDYGSREYSARDFEGNLWSFGSYDPWAEGK